ncbi:MAG: hypothetical protein CMJ85_02205 [Planctomycetes bacterium]|nr:hypothetical protein [Planctomycetota bacterium]MDP6425036.1 lipopolysaccharide kinase InaA family protein [Planctomycetota bacterium]
MRSRIWTAPEHAWLTALARGGFASVWDGLDGEVVDRNRLRRVERITTPGGVAYLKRFFGVQAKNELKLRFLQQPRCTSQAMRERLVIDKLHAEGFRPPEVLAAGDETSFGHERRSLLLTASLDGHALADTDDLPETTVLEVAEHLGSVTSKGVFLPDLGLDHVFASPGGYQLLDFHNARFGPRPSARELGRAIVRFFRSPGADGLRQRDFVERFARLFLRAAGRPEAEQRVFDLCRRRLAI